jgi:hypothetical protein
VIVCIAVTALLAFPLGMLAMAVLMHGRGPVIREDQL